MFILCFSFVSALDDGTRMFVTGNAGNVVEYVCSTGFDVSTCSYDSNFSVSSQELYPQSVAFNIDGTKMFIVGFNSGNVVEYVCSTGFDVSTCSYDSNFSVSAQDTAPNGFAFNSNGTKMFIVGNQKDSIVEYVCSTGFDVSTCSYDSNFSVSSQDNSPMSVSFNKDGTKMFMTGYQFNNVVEYVCSTGFDVSTCSYDSNFSVSTQEPSPRSIIFNIESNTNFTISAVNSYDLEAILNFTVNIQGVGNYSTTNGTIITGLLKNDTILYNITINSNSSEGYFEKTYNSYNVSSDLQGELYKSINSIYLLNKEDNSSISDFGVSSGVLYNSSVTNIVGLNLGSLNQVLTVGKSGYFNETQTFNFSALSYNNITFLIGNTTLNITATDLITGLSISNFSVSMTDLNGYYTESDSTTSGKLVFNLYPGLFNLTVDAIGYAIREINYTIENTTQVVNIGLYTTNSVNISWYNILTNQLLNTTTVYASFIGATKTNVSTSNGTYYIDLLSPDEYTIISTATGYNQHQYILRVNNRTSQDLSLYLQPENTTQLVLLKTRDVFSNPISNAEITIQRYVNNAWVTDQIVKTDFQGNAEAYFLLSTTYYNFIISYEGVDYIGSPNNDADKKVIYAEDVTSGLTFTLNLLGGSDIINFIKTRGTTVTISTGNITNTTGYFLFYFNNEDNSQVEACLQVKQDYTTTLCSCASNTVTSDSGSIICYVNISNSSVSTFSAVGFIDNSVAVTFSTRLGTSEEAVLDWGVSGYIFAFFIVLISFFIFINQPSLSIMIGTVALLLLVLMGVVFSNVNYAVFLVLLVIAWLIASIKSNSGVEG